MSYLTRFSQATWRCLPPPSGLSWNIYGKFCLFVQTAEVSQSRLPSSPSPAFIFFYPASPSPCSAHALQFTTSFCERSPSLSLSNTGVLPMLTADWNSCPSPLSFSVPTQILRNTNWAYNQRNRTISQGTYSTNLYEKVKPLLQQTHALLLRHLSLRFFSQPLATLPYAFWG